MDIVPGDEESIDMHACCMTCILLDAASIHWTFDSAEHLIAYIEISCYRLVVLIPFLDEATLSLAMDTPTSREQQKMVHTSLSK